MLHRHFADVAAAGVLPVVVYNNPLYTGNNLSPQLIASLMELDNVIGLKQSNDDLGQLVEALRLAGGRGRSLCTGIDSQFYAALCVGARGIFSTAAAIVPVADGAALRPGAGRRPRGGAAPSTGCCSRSTASSSTTPATSRRRRRRSS